MYSTMPRYHPAMRQTWFLALLLACGGKDDPTDDTGPNTGDTGDPPATGTPTTGDGGAPLGAPCDHAGVDFEAGPAITLDPACGGGFCLFGDPAQPPPDACNFDADCNNADPTKIRFQCQDNACVLADPYKQERSMCTRTCAVDSDCLDVAADTLCQTNFICVATTADCCQPVCLCNDDASAGYLDTVAAECGMSKTCDL